MALHAGQIPGTAAPRDDARRGHRVLDAHGRGHDAAARDPPRAVPRFGKPLGEASPGHRRIRARLSGAVAGAGPRGRGASPVQLDSDLCRAGPVFCRRRSVAETVRYKRALAACQRTSPRASGLARASRLPPLRQLHRRRMRLELLAVDARLWVRGTQSARDDWRHGDRPCRPVALPAAPAHPALGGTLAMAGYYTVLAVLELGSAFTT